MTDFFYPTPEAIVKPYALMDLDDTLFQTKHKIDAWQLPTTDLTSATVNKQGEPLSFFTPKQTQFFNWLLHSTELIPITARDTKEIQRVKLPFDSWRVLTHGAVIVESNGNILASWQSLMARQLMPLQPVLKSLIGRLHSHSDLRLTPHYEQFVWENQSVSLMVYLAIKHQHKNHDVLLVFAEQLPNLIPDIPADFYIHVNANNLAILPHVVHKHHALRFLLDRHLDKNRASFGFGDSLADLPFLQLLDWYGTPARGQLHDAISNFTF